MRIAKAFPSADGITTKYVLDAGESLVECTHVDRPEKHIVCFSTAVGCPVHCEFCAAAPFRRRLSAMEMVAQVRAVADAVIPPETSKPILFSAMGEGEPLLSRLAASALVEAFGQLVASRPGARTAVSTTAVKPSVVRWLSDVAPSGLKLQISLHAATDAQRRRIIPHAAPIAAVLAAGQHFGARRPGKLEWNYVLMAGLNDRDEDAYLLTTLLSPGSAVKLNRLNPVPGLAWKPSDRSREFAEILNGAGLRTEHYCTDGADVAAACGQLRSRFVQEDRSSPAVLDALEVAL